MARIHVLRGDGGNNYTAVVHAPAPTGNNAAGFTWASCIAASGLNTSIMTAGNGPGQTTNTELNAISAGTTIEAIFPFQDTPGQTNAERLAYLDSVAGQYVTELTERIRSQLNYYGLTRT